MELAVASPITLVAAGVVAAVTLVLYRSVGLSAATFTVLYIIWLRPYVLFLQDTSVSFPSAQQPWIERSTSSPNYRKLQENKGGE